MQRFCLFPVDFRKPIEKILSIHRPMLLRLLSEKGKSKKQVRGVFVPDSEKKQKPVVDEKPKTGAVLKESKSGKGREENEKRIDSSDAAKQ